MNEEITEEIIDFMERKFYTFNGQILYHVVLMINRNTRMDFVIVT